MANGKTKRNVALAGLGIGLLFLLGAGFADDEEPDEPGPDPDPDPDPGLPPDPFIFVPGVIDPPEPPGPFDPGIPWAPFTPPGEDPWNPTVYEHPSNYPTPGTFHQVESGDIFLGKGKARNMAWAALYEGAYAAAIEVGGVDEDEARAFAKHTADKASNRAKYTNIIQCSPWNDALYGTWGYADKSYPGPHGRAIRLLPHHPDNRSLIMQRQPPLRNVKMKTPNDKGKGNGGAIDSEYRDTWEYLWFPPLNLERLYSTGEITTEGLSWDDGSSMMLPPPEIWALGIDVLEDPGLPEYGCLGAEQELG